MLGKELRLLIILNNVTPKDIARAMGVPTATITRLCRPNRELALYEFDGVIDAIKKLTYEPIVYGVNLEQKIHELKFKYSFNKYRIPEYYCNSNGNGMGYNS